MTKVVPYLFLFCPVFGFAQENGSEWVCQPISLSEVETDTFDLEPYYVLPFSSEGYDSWCGSHLPTGNWVGYYDTAQTQLESRFYAVKGYGMHGECWRWYASGQVKRRAYYDQGEVTQYDSNWYENGNLYYTSQRMENGVTAITWWFSNGNLKRKYYWRGEQPYGTWSTYDLDGNLIREDQYETE